MRPHFCISESFRSSTAEGAREIYWGSFFEIITRLLKSGKTVYILYPIPELPVHISKAVTPFSIFGDKTMLDLNRSTSHEYYMSRNQFIISKLDTLQYGPDLYSITPFGILCDMKYCPAVSGRQALYFDDDHLSIVGAKKLIENSIIPDHIKQSDTSISLIAQ